MPELNVTAPAAPGLAATTIPRLVAEQVHHSARHARVGVPSIEDLTEALAEVTIRTQISGSSFLEVDVIDPDWKIQTSGFLTPNSDGLLPEVEVNFPDGSDSWWRLAAVDGGTDLSSANLKLTFEDRIVAYLRDHWGPKTAKHGLTTRAQFVKMLVDEVKSGGGIRFVCPSINQLQPVATSAQEEVTQTVQTPAGKATTTTKVNKTSGGPSLTSGQTTFASVVAQRTGLDVHVVAAWCLAEESGPAAQDRQAAGNHNWLNIGYFDAGPGAIAYNKAFSDATSAGEQTSKFLHGTWGGASGGIRAILKTANQDASAQISAIAGSGWASSGYNGGATLRTLYQQISGLKITAAPGGAGATPGKSDVSQLTRGTTDNPDENSWDAIARLASEVTWFAFSNASTLYYMDGPDLIAQAPACTIDRAAQSVSDRHGVETVGVVASIDYTFDNTAFQYAATRKVKGKIQRRSRVAKPATPSEVRLNMLCGIDDYRAGDVMVFANAGPINGRWIVTDATRACLADRHTQFTLAPPVAPAPEPQAQTDPSSQTPHPGKPPAGAPGSDGASAPSGAGGQVTASGKAFPMPPSAAAERSAWTLDQGVDISAPGHTPLFAVAAGTIVGHGISGFGDDAPILKLDHPISGYRYVYYGHAGPGNRLSKDVHVDAGATISEVGAGIVGISTGPHLEIGFCDANGNPVGPASHDTMHRLLMATYAPIATGPATSPH